MSIYVLTEEDIPELQERIEILQTQNDELEDRERYEYSIDFIVNMGESEYEYQKVFDDWRCYMTYTLPPVSKKGAFNQFLDAKKKIEDAKVRIQEIDLEQERDDEAYTGKKSNKEYINAKNRRKTAKKRAQEAIKSGKSDKDMAAEILEAFNAFDDKLDQRSIFPPLRGAPYFRIQLAEGLSEQDASQLNTLFIEHWKEYEKSYRFRSPHIGFPKDLNVWVDMVRRDTVKLSEEVKTLRMELDEAKKGDPRFPRLKWYEEPSRKKRCIGCNADKIRYLIRGTEYGVCSKNCY